jgi:hypothetical protein
MMLEHPQPHHQSNLFKSASSSTVIRHKSIGKVIPVKAWFAAFFSKLLEKTGVNGILLLLYVGHGPIRLQTVVPLAKNFHPIWGDHSTKKVDN